MSCDLVWILWAVMYFKDQLFPAFYRLFCKIATLWDIDLKFSGIISDINMDNPAKFREVSMPRSWISKNRDFRNFDLWFTNQARYVNSFWFCASIWVPTSGKFHSHIFCTFRDLRGVSQMPLSCQKRQMLLTINILMIDLKVMIRRYYNKRPS